MTGGLLLFGVEVRVVLIKSNSDCKVTSTLMSCRAGETGY